MYKSVRLTGLRKDELILTSFVSRAARRSMGKMSRKKTSERRANPPAARLCEMLEGDMGTRKTISRSPNLPRHHDQLRILLIRKVLLLDPSAR